jgi:hypothetical protein
VEPVSLDSAALAEMTISEFHQRGLEMVRNFRGRPKQFFAALKLEFPDSNLPNMVEHKRGKDKSDNEHLRGIFSELAAPAPTPIEKIGRGVVALATSPNPKSPARS